MKQNPNYILREVAGSMVLVPVGEATREFPGMVTMNPTSVYLWETLATPQTAETLVEAILSKFDADPQQAKTDVEKFLHTLTLIGAVIE